MGKLPMETHNPLFGRYLYPEAKAIMEDQQDRTWTAVEIPVEKDKHDYLHTMTPAQLRLSTTTLQLFVEIEQSVGDVWEQIASWYPHSEIEGACIEIARMEKSVHAFFYQKMSDVLNIDPEETLKQQNDIKVLKSKLHLLKSITSKLDENKPLSLATVAMIEQVLLFSNFAMLKSFKANGNNLIKNTLLGVDYVIDDEQLHGVLATYLHNTHIKEYVEYIGPFSTEKHTTDIIAVMEEIIKHEDDVIDYVFVGETSINSITPDQLKTFIRSRANDVLIELGIPPYYEVGEDKIREWFYKGIDSIKVHDFFSAGTNKYSKSWGFDGFSRLPFLKESHGK